MLEALIKELASIEDPRCEWKVEHRLLDILTIAVCAVLGEAGGGNVEPAGAVPGEAAPVGQPAEAALHHPAAGEHDEAPRGRGRGARCQAPQDPRLEDTCRGL